MSLIPTRLRRVFGQEPLEPELELTPEMEAPTDADILDQQEEVHGRMRDYRGMVRQPDHPTSLAAAKTVEPKRETLKSLVLQYARDAGHGGFTDSDLVDSEPTRPESSVRKRRTELTEKNWIVAAGFTRKNRHGQDSTVWLHREFCLSPPPLVSAPKKRKLSAEQEREKIVAWLRAQGERAASRALSMAADAIERGSHLQ